MLKINIDIKDRVQADDSVFRNKPFVNKMSKMAIEETLQIALDAHKGQKDLDGKAAILHPIAVGIMGSNDTEIKAGFLYDVVEDSDLTRSTKKPCRYSDIYPCITVYKNRGDRVGCRYRHRVKSNQSVP